MSLTSFLDNNSDVRAKLLSEFTKPDFRLKAEIKAPPLTLSYGLAGTAFDYLLHFYVQKLNPSAKKNGWVAEQAVALLSRDKIGVPKAKHNLAEARARYDSFLKSRHQRPSRDLTEASGDRPAVEPCYRELVLSAVGPQISTLEYAHFQKSPG